MYVSLIEWSDAEWSAICDASREKDLTPEALIKQIVTYDLQPLSPEEFERRVEAEKQHLLDAADAIRRRRERGDYP